MTSTLTTLAGALSRELARMPRATTDDCLAVDETVAAILRTLADGCDDCDSYTSLMDTASDIEATVERTEQAQIETARRDEWVRAYVNRVFA